MAGEEVGGRRIGKQRVGRGRGGTVRGGNYKCRNLQHWELWNTQKRCVFERFGLTSNQKYCIS